MSTNGKPARFKTQPKLQKPFKKKYHEHERNDPSSSEIPEWLQEFKEHLVDESVPEPRGARVPVLSDSHASSSMNSL